MKAGADSKARVITLAGGKGGVGTSLLATHLAIHLARQGREVVLIDLAPTGANLHAYLGLKHPQHHLGAMLRGSPPELSDLLSACGISNLRLLAGVLDRPLNAAPADNFSAKILESARRLACDFVIADVGSGHGAAVRLACAEADTSLLVSTPEPCSASGVLSLQAAILYALMERALGPKNARSRYRTLENKGLRAVFDNLQAEPEQYAKLLAAVQSHGFGLILNQVRIAAETENAARIGAILSMIQATFIDPVMTLEYDLSALQAISERAVLAQRYPNAPLVRGVEKLAFCLLSPPPALRPQPSRYVPLHGWHHYRLLALDPKASPREVQRHYERLKAPFVVGHEAEAVASRRTLDRVLAQIESAYRTLIFLENRREYDASLVASGVLSPDDLRDLQSDSVVVATDAPDMPENEVPVPVATREVPFAPEPANSTSARADDSAAVPDREEPATGTAGTTTDRPRRSSARRPAGPTVPAMTLEPLPMIADTNVLEAPPARYSGAVLRDLRQKRRLDLDKIAAVTKIRSRHIASIENENYAQLPVAVFVKGFVRAYARCLDLDAERVVKDYMDGYGAWIRERT